MLFNKLCNGTGLVQLAQFLTNSTIHSGTYKRSSAAPWDKNSNLLAIKGWKNNDAAINFSYFSPYDSLWAPLEAAITKLRHKI